jgi:hypothetical protein
VIAPTVIEVHLCGIGLLGPGLAGYTEDSRKFLAGRRLHRCEPTPDPVPPLLPPNERRRSSALVRHALAVAEEAIQGTELDPGTLATVFASSGGEYALLDRICAALASPERALSPTLFHHSVHNAAAGYFAIATGSRRPRPRSPPRRRAHRGGRAGGGGGAPGVVRGL